MAPVIAGVGIDAVDVARFQASARRHGARFLARVYTSAERRYCARCRHPWIHYAARFAAKEAVLKALGTGWSGGIRWTDVEVVRAAHGEVSVKLAGKARTAAARRKIRRIHLSLTHTAALAAAVAVAATR